MDLTWEQKARISALRAACAAPLWVDDNPNRSEEESDEMLISRYLDRAEVFRRALMNDGPLNEVEIGDVVFTSHTATCKYCLRAIVQLDDSTWIDPNGTRYCGKAQTLMHCP